MAQTIRSKDKVKKINDKGFTLIEMSMVMVIVGIVISIMMTVLPSIMKTSKIKEARANLEKYDNTLQGYALANSKLPFAAEAEDGVETKDLFSGYLPYVTLGLSQGKDVWGHTVKYAAYGKTANPKDLNLAILKTEPSKKSELCDKLDEIAKIEAAPGFTYDKDIVYTTPSNNCDDTNSTNQAYVIASGGPKDLDKDKNHSFFDLCAATTDGIGFNAENKSQASNYDDLVRPFSLGELSQLIGTRPPPPTTP